MMRKVCLAASVSTAAALGAFRNGNFLSASMQPEVVARTLAHVEDEWKAQAAIFAECTSTEDSIVDCAETPESFGKSCATVVHAIVQGSGGDPDVTKEYMNDVCAQKIITDWHRTSCVALSSAVTAKMSASSYENRANYQASKVCEGFWSRFVGEQREAAARKKEEEKKAAETAAEEAKQMKLKAEAAEKAEAEAKKEEKAKTAADSEEAKKRVAQAATGDKAFDEEKAKAAAVLREADEKMTEANEVEKEGTPTAKDVAGAKGAAVLKEAKQVEQADARKAAPVATPAVKVSPPKAEPVAAASAPVAKADAKVQAPATKAVAKEQTHAVRVAVKTETPVAKVAAKQAAPAAKAVATKE